MRRKDVDRNKVSPMMLQYLELKDKYEDSIIFFRLGDFYEMFFEDAIIASRELELTLTGKNCGLENRVDMCGIPHHSYQIYMDKLIEKGYKVAIAEQLTDPKKTKTVVERDVVQIITKGTRLDDNLSSKDYNYIANIFDFEYCYGFSYTDISTGYFYTMMLEYKKEEVINQVINHNIKELIVNDKINREIINELREKYNILITINNDINNDSEYEFLYKDIEDVRLINTVKHLLNYLVNTKKSSLSYLQKVELINKNKYLLFDYSTKRNLELVETIRNREKLNSLLWLLDKCKTAMGSRYLKLNIENPLTSKKEINRRLDLIEKFLTEFILKDELRNYLDSVYDLERLSSRISYGNLNAKDLIQLKNSIKVLPNIKDVLDKIGYDKELETLNDLYNILDKSINEDAPNTLKEGNLIKEGYSSEVDDLRNIRRNSKDFILNIEKEEKEKTGIKNLKVGFNKVFGYYIEVSKGNLHMVKDEFGYIRKQTLTTGERYITTLLKEKEDIILSAEEKIINLEYKIFMEIRDEVKKYIKNIQDISKIIGEVDMILSLSYVSEENSYIRPKFTKEHIINIKDSRHPVVEKVLKDAYVTNDIIMNKNTNILLITGPNMAGKSTFMRQLAIIVIMAQIGSFVPCSYCEIPIFDKIFTRIGASDDLVSGDSTFMVEMREANFALSNATENSLILFDELGRGTATYDGMSLAEAILEYIHDNVGAKTLFSTHYHELTKLSNKLKYLKNVHVSANMEGNKLIFLHKVKNGAVDKSYGINVASLAHLPKEVIKRAEEILDVYENNKKSKENIQQMSLILEFNEDKKDSDILNERLKDINPLELTPIQALNILYELKEELRNKKE